MIHKARNYKNNCIQIRICKSRILPASDYWIKQLKSHNSIGLIINFYNKIKGTHVSTSKKIFLNRCLR